MSSIKSKLAKEFIDKVSSPEFSNYSFCSKLTDDETGAEINKSSLHLVYVGDNTYAVLYNEVTGTLQVNCVNANTKVFTATYDEERRSWTIEDVLGEELLSSSVIHACRVLRRVHMTTLENLDV